jgi:PqqD family protein of HPr-rel-A system
VAPKLWRVPENWRLEWRQWGGLHVVYNPASGDTHLLNAIPAYVLRSLETKTLSIEELKALVKALASNSHDRPPDDALSSDIEALVTELDELGLIAPAQS